MDFKEVNNNISGSYYNIGWFVKNIIITIISSIPAFIWANYKGDDTSLGIAIISIPVIFVIVFIGDLLRRVAMPKAVISEGGAWEMIKKKIYWSIGPQFSAVFFAYITLFIFLSIFSDSFKSTSAYKPFQETGIESNQPTPAEEY